MSSIAAGQKRGRISRKKGSIRWMRRNGRVSPAGIIILSVLPPCAINVTVGISMGFGLIRNSWIIILYDEYFWPPNIFRRFCNKSYRLTNENWSDQMIDTHIWKMPCMEIIIEGQQEFHDTLAIVMLNSVWRFTQHTQVIFVIFGISLNHSMIQH